MENLLLDESEDFPSISIEHRLHILVNEIETGMKQLKEGETGSSLYCYPRNPRNKRQGNTDNKEPQA